MAARQGAMEIRTAARKLEANRSLIVRILSNCSWVTRKIDLCIFQTMRKGCGAFEQTLSRKIALGRIHHLRSPRFLSSGHGAGAFHDFRLGAASAEAASTIHAAISAESPGGVQSRSGDATCASENCGHAKVPARPGIKC